MSSTAFNCSPVASCAEDRARGTWLQVFPVQAYDLAATLSCGQAFRWYSSQGGWEGVVARRWVRLTECESGLVAETAEPVASWDWLADYLQVQVDLEKVLAHFPGDEPMHQAVAACRGLRLLRQEPWECLASFILSSTKQILQIQQIIRLLSERLGAPVRVPPGHLPAFSFPGPDRLVQASELELRACKMGFRAPYLRETAACICAESVDLNALGSMAYEQAREQLLRLPGVGPKIANCVLLFAYGFQQAFPVDVWVRKALRELYFRNRSIPPARVLRFSRTHFGPYAGYAQQYLFHYMRTKGPGSRRNKGRLTA